MVQDGNGFGTKEYNHIFCSLQYFVRASFLLINLLMGYSIFPIGFGLSITIISMSFDMPHCIPI